MRADWSKIHVLSRLRAVSLFCQEPVFLQLATHVRERRATKPRDARNEGVPFPSRAFSHARVHSRAFCSTEYEKRDVKNVRKKSSVLLVRDFSGITPSSVGCFSR